jgi:hypothetical protein
MSRRPRPVSRTKTILVGSALLALTAVLIVVLVLRLASSPDAKVQLGDEVFEVGQVRILAPEVDKAGPLLFADPLKRNRDLYIQHLGNDPKTGWLAFEAHARGQDRRCTLKWSQEAGLFTDPCSHATYPVDGKGLTRYRTEVNRKGKGGLTLFVDLRTPLTD